MKAKTADWLAFGLLPDGVPTKDEIREFLIASSGLFQEVEKLLR
jgi:hypothetical protein